MGSNNFFKDCRTLKEVQTEFAWLMMCHHPKQGGALFIWQEILKDYFMLQYDHTIISSLGHLKKHQFLDQFRSKLERILHMGLRFKVVGNQITVIGDTECCQHQLKELGIVGPPYVFEVTDMPLKTQQYESVQ